MPIIDKELWGRFYTSKGESPPNMSDAEFNFKITLLEYKKIYSLVDVMERELVITPFGGNYGVAGYIIVINGSPPRGIVMVIGGGTESITGMAVVGNDGRAKRIESLSYTSHLKSSIHRRLWEVTVDLLKEYTGKARIE